MFVRYYETGGRTLRAGRPAGVEGWLPIASLMNLKALVATGRAPLIHPAGTVSEYLWRAGRKWLGRNFRIPRVVDVPLRGLKYLLLGLFLYAVSSMPAPAIREFLDSPYGMVDDVKMLNFFRELGMTGGGVLLVLVLGL